MKLFLMTISKNPSNEVYRVIRSALISISFITCMITISKAGDTTLALHYLVREPKIKSQHPPAIILLHGVGSNEEDLFSFANQLPEKYLVIAARAPIVLGENSFAWYQVDFTTGKPVFNVEDAERSRVTLIQFIAQIKEKYAVERNELYLCGFSQGAIMSYSIGLTRPDLVKGIAVMSGRLLEEIKPLIVMREKLKTLKVFIAHGLNDKILPIQYSRGAVSFIKLLHIKPHYKEYQAEHEINSEMFSDLVNWLE